MLNIISSFFRLTQNIKGLVVKGTFLAITFSVIIWLSIFLYGMFYCMYIPAVSHIRPVHLQFDSSSCSEDICSFPMANITLVKRGHDQLLARGQQYKIFLDLEMPESEANQRIGMFMVQLRMIARSGEILRKSQRAGVLHYKSPLLRYLHTLFNIPFLLSGSVEEKQIVSLQLFEGYEEDPDVPATHAQIEVQNKQIQIYAATLKIHAHFTGLRYILYYWPLFSAVVGISTNLFFLSMVAVLSWYRYLVPAQRKKTSKVYLEAKKRAESKKRKHDKVYKEKKEKNIEEPTKSMPPDVANVKPVEDSTTDIVKSSVSADKTDEAKTKENAKDTDSDLSQGIIALLASFIAKCTGKPSVLITQIPYLVLYTLFSTFINWRNRILGIFLFRKRKD